MKNSKRAIFLILTVLTAISVFTVAAESTEEELDIMQPTVVASAKTVKLSKPKIKSLESSDDIPAVIKYSKVKKADGYEVYVSDKKDGEYTLCYSGKALEFKHLSLKEDKDYFFKVRAFANSEGQTFYSDFSSVKSVEAECDGLRISKSCIRLYKKKSATVKATYNGKKAKDVKWTSSDTSVVTVKGGKITAKKKLGEATVTLKKGSFSMDITVYVTLPAKSIKLNPKKLRLKIDTDTQLYPLLTPVGCMDEVIYKSSNKKIATVTADGIIKTKKAGSCTVTAKTKSGKSASCTVKVIDFRLNTKKVCIKKGQHFALKAKTGKVASYTSSDKSIAKVSKKGKITAVNHGSCTIYATDKTGLVCEVNMTVRKPYTPKLKAKVKNSVGNSFCFAFALNNNGSETITLYSDGAYIETPGVKGSKRKDISLINVSKIKNGSLSFIKSLSIKKEDGKTVEFFWDKSTFINEKTVVHIKAKYDGVYYMLDIMKGKITYTAL